MRVTRAQNAAWRSVDGEMVVLNLANKRLYGLGHHGSELWSALDETSELEQLVALLGLPGAQVARFVEELQAEGLVEITPPLQVGPRPQEHPKDALCIAWSEEVSRAVGQCMHLSGQNAICAQFPQSS